MTLLPDIILAAWEQLGDGRTILGHEETSPGVSTNRVFRLDLSDGQHIFCKNSSYGSYVHFRQDHERVLQWHRALAPTRFAGLLATPLSRAQQLFTFHRRGSWVVFYQEAERASPLPPILDEPTLEALAREMAELHQVTTDRASLIQPNWATVGADVATLFDRMTADREASSSSWTHAQKDKVAHHCERFLTQADHLGYHQLPRIPVLVDWNRGNFSMRHDERGSQLFSRWDYDWFRIEPRVFDFYFLARLVRAEGDQPTFSYTLDPLFEPRFVRFLRVYHEVFPLSERELLFMREAFRFFLLNYVLLKGEHFFVPTLCERLQQETLDEALDRVDEADFDALIRAVAP